MKMKSNAEVSRKIVTKSKDRQRERGELREDL